MADVFGTLHSTEDPSVARPVSGNFNGERRSLQQAFTLPAGVAVGDVLVIGRVGTTAIMTMIGALRCEALGAGVEIDIGFRHPAAPDAAVAAVAISEANDCAAEIDGILLAGATNIDLEGKQAWQRAGFTEDPGGTLEVIATISAGTPTAGAKLFIDLAFNSW